jgi:3'-5' exoribonuclease
MIPEAEMLHHLDVIDARMYDMNKALGETVEGKFSERIWSLDNISVYKSFINKQAKNL